MQSSMHIIKFKIKINKIKYPNTANQNTAHADTHTQSSSLGERMRGRMEKPQMREVSHVA